VCSCLFQTSQLPFISGGHLLHPEPEDATCHGYKDPHNVAWSPFLHQIVLFIDKKCVLIGRYDTVAKRAKYLHAVKAMGDKNCVTYMYVDETCLQSDNEPCVLYQVVMTNVLYCYIQERWVS
jgi:hypothetical protein